MIIYFLGAVLVAAVLCGPAWWFARRRNVWYLWDYASIVVPFALWLSLTAMGYGPQSLSNLIEAVILIAVIPVLVTSRILVIDRLLQSPRAGSVTVFVVCVLAAVGLRTFMPLLPE